MLVGKIVAQLLIAFVYTIIIIQAVPFVAYNDVKGKIDNPILGGAIFILISGIFAAISLVVWGIL